MREVGDIVNHMNTITAPADYTAATSRVPVGLSANQRASYLALSLEQRRIYRYHYDVCGRLAEHCHRIATTGSL